MSKTNQGKRILSFAEIKISEQELENTEFQVLRTGEFFDRRYGKFKVTKELLERIKKNFDENVLKIDVALDVGHDPNGGAYAWVKTLEVRGDVLYAKFRDFTEDAKKIFKQKIFKYFSVEFSPFETVKSGKKMTIKDVLRGIALTNRPVIKGMAPTFLSEGINSFIKNSNMSIVKMFCEELLQREAILSEDVKALKLMFAALSEEEQAEAKESVDKVEAEAEKQAEEKTEEEKTEEKEEEEKEDPEKKEEDEGDEAVKAELAEMREAREKDAKELAELKAEKEERVLSEAVESVMLSKDNLTGFSAEKEKDVRSFMKSLSEDQRAEFSEILKSVKALDEGMFEEAGSAKEGGEKDDEAKEEEAQELCEKKMKADPSLKRHEALSQAYAELKMV